MTGQNKLEAVVPTVRQGLMPTILATALLIGTAGAEGTSLDPAEAFAFDSGQPVTARALEQALRDGNPWEQLDWTFTLRPSVLYRQYLDERGGTTFNPRLSSTLQVRFGESPLDAVRRAGRLERALRAHDRARRLETRNALLAFGELLIAQDSYYAASLALQELPPEATGRERQSVELDYRIERADLDAARLDAASYGMHGTAVYRSLRFQVPPAPSISDLSDYRLQELVLAEAETRLLAAGGSGVLKDLRLGVGYRTDGVEVSLETGYMSGRPGLRLGTIHPGGRARMDLRVSAELAIGDGLRELPRLREDVEIASSDLEYLDEEMWAEWLAASLDAELAEETLDYEEAILQEEKLALETARADLASLPHDAEERDRARLQTAVFRAEREVLRLTTRVNRAWIAHIRRHHDMLEAAGALWAIR